MKFRISKTTLLLFVVFLILLVARVPFYLTHHVQEDAYITLRCAKNLAETGVYGFNPGERVSASTSHGYVFLAATIYILVGKTFFIPVVLVINTILFLFGAYFIAKVLLPDGKWSTTLWVMISTLPVSLMISYSGMETSLLIFILGLVFYLLQRRKSLTLAWVSIAFIPWIRPDAVAYALIIIFWYCLLERRLVLAPVLSLLIGIAALLSFNLLYFGSLLNQPIIAKSLTQPSFTIGRFFTSLRLIFAENVGGIFNPIRTKYFDNLGYIFLILVTLGILAHVWRKRSERKTLFFVLAMVSLVFAVPAAYAAGGVIYPWYLWPCALFAYAILLALVMEIVSAGKRGSRALAGAVMIALVGMFALQWAYSYSWGMKERAYRGGIGEYLAKISEPGDTLFLEPAGYIPYYSGIYTHDEVGLVSPLILKYRADDPQGWWMDFVREVKPVWLVERGHITSYETYQGYEFSPEEREWFDANYTLVHSFEYNPEDYTSSPILTRLLELGTIDDYYIFKIIP